MDKSIEKRGQWNMNTNLYGVPEVVEEEAHGHLSEVYGDIKYVLKVPIVNFIFRTLGLYKKFLAIGWSQVRPSMLTTNMEQAAEKLRYPEISVTPPNINWLNRYDPATIEKIRRTIFTFNYVNTKLLLIASAWAESLGNRPVLGGKKPQGFIAPGIIPGLPSIHLVDINDAPIPIRDLLLDIAGKHHTMDVASDFRALAHYPDFLNTAWFYLREYVGSKEYDQISAHLKQQSIESAHQMPFQVTINKTTLEAFYSPAEIAGIMGIVATFQQFIPALIIDGEFLRRIIR
jgi:hypothetical protein